MMHGQSSGTQVIGWVMKLPKQEGGKITLKLLKRSWKGDVVHRQPFYSTDKVINISDVQFKWKSDKHADVDAY